jgi:hypothetical protein
LKRLVVGLLFAAALAACVQPLDRAAAAGASSEPVGESGLTSPPVDLVTPPIDLGGGKTTSQACVRTAQRALEIRKTYCASCHAPPAKMGGFDFVLDDKRLVAAVSSTNVDEAGQPQRLVIPGNAKGSSLYRRVIQNQMPPVVAPPLPPNPPPTVSDFSEMEEWIDHCLGAQPSKPSEDAGIVGDAGPG